MRLEFCLLTERHTDFSSAFNTIQPHLLTQKLKNMCLHPNIKWILHYLTDRPQHVRLQNNRANIPPQTNTRRNKDAFITSDTITTFTGATQGTVLSPFLFTLYTSDFSFCNDACHLQKFSDDSAVVGLITNGNEKEYRDRVDDFVEWCENNFLLLNVSKTKELVIDFRRKKKSQVVPIQMKGADIEIVDSYKYLGVVIDSKLNWSLHIDKVYKKTQSRLFFLRKLKSFHVCNRMMKMFYDTVICSLLSFALVCWGVNATERDKNRINKLIRKAGSIVGEKLNDLNTILDRRLVVKGGKIEKEELHPLHNTLIKLKSSSRTRSKYHMPNINTDRYGKSFIPTIVKVLNKNK